MDCKNLATNNFNKEVEQTEEDFVTNALWQLLKRQPTVDDFSKCYRVFYRDMYEYMLYYGNKKLGTIKRIFEANKFMMKFIPDGST